MCFVWIWEQTAIISLYSINWPVFITETECVYCAVRTGSLNVVEFNVSPSACCQVAGLSLLWPLFDPRPVHVGFVVDKVALGTVFSPIISVCVLSTIPPVLHSNLYFSTRTSGEAWEPSSKEMFFRILGRRGEHWIVECFHIVFHWRCQLLRNFVLRLCCSECCFLNLIY